MTRPDYTTLLPGALLAATAGSLDGYTFLHQGAVFAGLQTGNLILLGVHLGGGQWPEAPAQWSFRGGRRPATPRISLAPWRAIHVAHDDR